MYVLISLGSISKSPLAKINDKSFLIVFERINSEYKVPAKFEETQFVGARWISGPEKEINQLIDVNRMQIAKDHDNDWVFLIRIDWDLKKNERDFPNIQFNTTKETQS